MRPGISPGDRVEIHDDDRTPATVVMVRGSSITVQTDDGELIALPVAEFFTKIGVDRTTNLFPHLTNNPEWARAMRLAEHIIEVEEGRVPGKPQKPAYNPHITSITERVEAKVTELGKIDENSDHPDATFNKPKFITIQRWRRKYKEGGVGALVDQRKMRKSMEFGNQPEEVVAIVKEVLAERVDETTIFKTTFHDEVRRRVKAWNRTNGTTITVPSEATVRRMTTYLGKGRYMFGNAKTRRSNHSSPFSDFVPSYALRPGDIVQIDSTKLDLMSKGETGDARRFELTVAVDVATRAVVGHRITEYSSNAIDIAQMIVKILTPEPFRDGWEDRLRFNYASIPHNRAMSLDDRFEAAAKIPVVFPDTIVIDNGKPYLSHMVLDTCEQLGISIDQSRPGTGHDKGIVERWFRTINSAFTVHLEGYVSHSAHLRGKDDPKPDELLTLEELNELFTEFLVEWHGKPQSSLCLPHRPDQDVSPNDYFDYAAAAYGYLPRPVSLSESITLLPGVERDVHSYGVEINKRIYDARELNPMRGKPNKNNKPTEKWMFHYDPDNLASVYFYDKSSDTVIAIPIKGIERIDPTFTEARWDQAFKHATSRDVERRHAQAIHALEKLGDELADGTATKRAQSRIKQRDPERQYEPGTPTPLVVSEHDDDEELDDDWHDEEEEEDNYDFA